MVVLVLLHIQLLAQSLVTNITINMPANPPANTAAWANAVPPVLITAKGATSQGGQVNGTVQESRILVSIKRDGSKVCGLYTKSNAPSANFNTVVKSWSGSQIVALLGQECTLQPGTYELCVQYYGMGAIGSASGLLGEACKPFTIADTKDISYAPPQNINPTNGQVLKPAGGSLPVTLRWTPIIPKPQTSVTYRLKVWQLMQGQSGTTAMRTNTPIVEREVTDQTQLLKANILGDIEKVADRDAQLVWQVMATTTTPQNKVEQLGNSEPTTFNIVNEDKPNTVSIRNLYPENKKVLSEKEANTPLNFKWTPLVPKPKDNITYRLKVWQLMQGQSGAQAMRTNKPIVTKDVDNVTTYTKQNLLGDIEKIANKEAQLIWQVEALEAVQGGVKNLASSEPTQFAISSGCSPTDELTFTDSTCSQQDGLAHIAGYISLTVPSGVTISTVKITKLTQGSYFGAAVATTYTLPTTLTLSSGKYPFSFVVNESMCNKKLYVGYQYTYTCATTGLTKINDCVDSVVMPCCKCTLCDQVQWKLPQTITYDDGFFNGTNNVMNLSGTLGFAPYKVIKLSAEVVDFYWYIQGDCQKCNSNDYYYGNIKNGSLTTYTGTGVAYDGIPLLNSHQLDFVSPTLNGNTLNNPLSLNITLPPQTKLSCCTDCFRFCVRYTATFMDGEVCKTCSIVKCYETKRTHKNLDQIAYPGITECGDQRVRINGEQQK